MNRLNASIITAGVLMLLSPLSLMADNKKEQQEQMRLVIEVLHPAMSWKRSGMFVVQGQKSGGVAAITSPARV